MFRSIGVWTVAFVALAALACALPVAAADEALDKAFDTLKTYDWGAERSALEALDKRNVLQKVHILAGLVPLKSARAAVFMSREVPGVVIPDETETLIALPGLSVSPGPMLLSDLAGLFGRDVTELRF